MCAIVHKECVPFMFPRAYRAAELRVNMLKDNIEMDIKNGTYEYRTEINLFNTLL
jgi:hypothetical protein